MKEDTQENNKDKLKHNIRFAVLLIACLSMFCDYYIIDIPALLKTELVQYFEPKYGAEQSEIMFSFMYSFYNVPNIILPLFGGILCDQIGYRTMTVVFISFITLGQIVSSIGLEIENFWCMVIGRFIFGIGGESLNISIQTLTIKWFKGSELSFAQALNLSLMRLANVLNNYLTPRIAEYKNMNYSFGFGICICLMSLFMSIIMVFLDKIFDKKENEKENDQQQEQKQSLSVFSYFKDMLSQIKNNITKFDKLFWCVSILCVFLYISVITFNTFSSTIIIDMWLPKENTLERNQEIAGGLMSIPYIIGSFLFPLFGLLTDKIGQRVNLLILAPLILITAFLILPVVYPTTTFVLLGLAYAIFGSVLWPTIAYIVPEDKIGIGYGIINAVQNAGMGLFPLLIAFIELKGSSIYIVICFTIISGISLLFSLVLKYLDSKRDISLNDSNQENLMTYLQQQTDIRNNKNILYKQLPQQQDQNEKEQLPNQNVY